MSERDDHKSEMTLVVFMNTLVFMNKFSLLKSELAEMVTKYNDLSDYRDRLQVLVSEVDDCRNRNEQSLLQIQALQEEPHRSTKRTYELQHQLDLSKVDETIKLCD
ncbi:hypothetical protein EVAR_24846_1 [Eumeta japonica]|uniref:Uncharacterized protein n=1 Tax=Eumeta variegata TaxID=151549 RepID=A0A4C1Y8N9_EUMVA|nr:hypothetical protein EVAR_24846_1 [Eumeta japonica]